MSNAIQKTESGLVYWDKLPGDKYLATGIDRNGKRFRIESGSWEYIRCINIWRGNKWLCRNGKREKIQSVYN